MKQRYGLDAISYLTDVSLGANHVQPEEEMRQELNHQIERKKKELNALQLRLLSLEPKVPA